MPDYNPGLLYQGLSQGLSAFADAQEEQKTRAREFKALQEFADATGIAGKDQTTVMDLESLKGFVRGAESKRAIQEQQRKAQMEQAQFENLQKHQADMLGVSRQGMALEGMRTLGSLFNQDRDNTRADERLGMDRQTNAATLARFATADAERKAIDRDSAGAWQHIARYSTAPGGTGPVLPMGQTVPEALAQFPLARKDNNLDNMLGVLGKYSLQADADHVPRMVNLGGVNTIYSPKGGQFQIAPNSSLPEDLPEVPGHTAVPNGKGGVAYVKNGELTDTQRHSRLAAQERVLLNSISRAVSEEEKTGYRRQLRGVQEDIRNIESGGANPAAEPAQKSPHPDGTILQDGSGKRYKVVNGQPVPL